MPRHARGFDVDQALAHLQRSDRKLAGWIRRLGPLPAPDGWKRSFDPVDALARAILFQQLSGKAASTIVGRVEALTKDEYLNIPALEEKLRDMKTNGAPTRSKSIVRFQRSGYRVDPEEMLEAIIRDLEATIAATEDQIETTTRAMETFKDDPFYPTVTGRYIDRYEDEDIADDLGCSTTQVWRQRSRIVKDIAILLFGTDAV